MLWNTISKFILKNKFLIFSSTLILTIVFSYLATKVEISYEEGILLDSKDEDLNNYYNFKKTFNITTYTVVIGIEADSVFSKKVLNQLYELDNQLQNTPYVINVLSLPSTIKFEKDNNTRSFILKKLFNRKILRDYEVEEIEKFIKTQKFYHNLIYNPKNDFTIIVLNIDEKRVNSKNRKELIREIIDLTEKKFLNENVKIYFSGLPYIRNQNSIKVQSEMKLFILISMLITSIIIYFMYNSFRILLMCILVLGISVVWSFAAFSILGFKVSMVSFLVPTLMIIISIPNLIFIVNKFHLDFKTYKNKNKAIYKSIITIGKSMFYTNITTAVGFLTFAITSTSILYEFGIISSICIVFTFLIDLSIIPICLSFMKDPKQKHLNHLDYNFYSKLINILNNIVFIKTYRQIAILFFLIITIISIFGLVKIKTTGNYMSDINQNTKLYKDLKFFEDQMGGVIPIEIIIDTKKENNILKSSIINKINLFQEEVNKMVDNSRTLSYLDAIKLGKQAYYDNDSSKYSLPEGFEKNFIFSYLKESENTNSLINAFIDEKKQKSRISIRIKDTNSNEILNLKEKIIDKFNEIFKNNEASVYVTGSGILFAKNTNYLQKNLYQSLILAILIILILLMFLFKSPKLALISLIPNIIPLLTTAAIMGFFNIPLKPSTILTFSISFGICVDNSIHFLTKLNLNLKYTNNNLMHALKKTIKNETNSICYSSFILLIGFSIFIFSSFGGTIDFGKLLATTIFSAFLCDLILLPCLVVFFELVLVKKLKVK